MASCGCCLDGKHDGYTCSPCESLLEQIAHLERLHAHHHAGNESFERAQRARDRESVFLGEVVKEFNRLSEKRLLKRKKRRNRPI